MELELQQGAVIARDICGVDPLGQPRAQEELLALVSATGLLHFLETRSQIQDRRAGLDGVCNRFMGACMARAHTRRRRQDRCTPYPDRHDVRRRDQAQRNVA